MNTTRRRFLTGLSVMAVAPVLASCGSDDEAGDSAGSGSPEAGGGAGGGAFPATIAHKFGSTEVTAAPQRVVCVGLVEQDALLALGVTPVGVTYWFGDESLEGIYPWAEEALGDAAKPAVLDNTNGVPIEAVAELAPDLIIGQYAGITQAEYDLLSQIAPTVAQSGDYADFGMPWEDSTLNIGAAIGKPEEAQALVDDVSAQIQQAAADNPQFAGQTAVVVTAYEGLFVYGPEDPRGRILSSLGFTFPEQLLVDGTDEFGYSLSAERTSDLADVGVVVWLDKAADQGIETAFDQTAAGEEGRWFDINEEADGSYYVAQSFVTPLSIPYVLERYLPQLAAAADGDPATVPPPSA